MTTSRPTDTAASACGRRRFLSIAAAATGVALLPGGLQAEPGEVEPCVWRGVALGARASIRMLHQDRAEARRLIGLAVWELERLEAIFSLYRPDSAVVELNRAGRLPDPPIELVELLASAREISRASGGAFDVTVQPLWRRYRDHFAASGTDMLPQVSDLMPLVDWRGVRVEPREISFARPGMAITLNGIAQGYVTDRVAELLRRNGVERTLLDLGETRTVGDRGAGRPWRVGVADPTDPARSLATLDCFDRAIASSGGYGTVFDRAGRYSHLIDPRTGRTAPVRRGITVMALEATLADALSTAFSMMDENEISGVARLIGGVDVYRLSPGQIARLV